MVIGQSIASERLRKNGIVTVDLNRITLAGKVKLFCFDKTGTLTKEGLDFMGVQEADDENNFAEVTTYFDSFGDIMKRIMLTCHTLTTIKDKFVGNFVDIEMFRVTSGSLVNAEGTASASTVYPSPSSNIPPLRIIKRFEFSHKHAYMSSIVRDTATGRLSVYMKGSCEKIKELVDPDTIPADYDEAIKFHSSKGFYLIATAYCELPAGTSQDVAMHWPREFLEKNACFIGFMMFRNEVKPDTAQALSELRRGGCRVSMITGDNINTAIYIAWASGMIKKDWQKQDPLVIIGDVKEKEVEWINTDDNSLLSPQILDTLIQRSRKGFRPVEIAITGKAFHKLTQEGWLQRNILEVRIFARMKPMDKVKCIRLHMEKGITAMCGDGGNDAGALKACHTGIALSNGDTSVVGHFSTRSTSINACVELLKEARCSLDISFAAYKYLMMYGEILAFVGMVQYLFKVNISQAAYILIDACTVPFSWALSMAKPNKTLVETRPTAKLLGYETILSVVGQIAIDVVFMAVAIVLLISQPFYKCHGFDNTKVDISRWWELADNYEAQVTSLMLIFQIFHAAAALNIGWRYRQGFIKNWKFVLVYTSLISILCYIALADPNPLGCLFRINCGTKEALQSLGYTVNFSTPTEYYSAFGHNVIPQYFRYVIICISATNLLAVLAWEGIFIQGAGRRWALRRWQRPKNEYRY
jgi:cation-transporting ATPase 13A3/4/5